MTLKPLLPTGNQSSDDDPELDDLLGCHGGSSFGLNVANPQPGQTYKWIRKAGRDIAYYRRLGGTVVQKGDPEWSVGSKMLKDMGATPIDDSDIYEDVVLMKFPEEAIRQQTEREQAKSQAQLRSGAEEYVSQATAAELRASGSRPSRFAERNHRLDFHTGLGEDSPISDTWTPDDGVVDR
jgi:hypothetical protein